MKRALLYTVTAVLLGAVVMLLPLQLFFMAHGEEPFVGQAPYLKPLAESESWQGMTTETYNHEAGRVVREPADPFVEILGVSFLVSLVVYVVFRRRRPYSSHEYYPLLHP